MTNGRLTRLFVAGLPRQGGKPAGWIKGVAAVGRPMARARRQRAGLRTALLGLEL
jgi:hypothetical protein